MKNLDMNSIGFKSEVDFLSNYHKKLKQIRDYIVDLKNQSTDGRFKGKKFGVIMYSELDNTWDVRRFFGRPSINIDQLTNKLLQMIEKGNSDNIEPLLRKLINKPNSTFKWNWGNRYKLLEVDRKLLKEYFKI